MIRERRISGREATGTARIAKDSDSDTPKPALVSDGERAILADVTFARWNSTFVPDVVCVDLRLAAHILRESGGVGAADRIMELAAWLMRSTESTSVE